MSITVPFRRVQRQPIQRQQPKPQFLQMAAATMAQEGKFGQSPQPAQPGDAYASTQQPEGLAQ